MNTTPPNVGQQGLNDATSEFNILSFIVEQILGRAAVATLVQVIAVANSGAVSPVGFVACHPLVNQIDGAGNPTPHGTLYNLPYIRIQGGLNAIIIDPQVGDIGLAIICDEDISLVKANKGEANPGSFRRFDLADGIYLGGCMNGAPNQYVQFTSEGITIADLNGNKIVMGSSGIAFTSVGQISSNQDIKAGSISLQEHVHPGVQSGSDDTEPPTG